MQVADIDVRHAIALSERIDSGEFVAISADRTAINNPHSAVRVPFLGAEASFPRGPLQLATALQAPVIHVCCIELAGRYHVYFDVLSEGGAVPRKQRQDYQRQLLRNLIASLERHCLQAPWQWYNFFDFWAPAARQEQGL